MSPFKLFRLKPEERVQGAVVLVAIVALNALFILRMHALFMQPGFGGYWSVFEREVHLSGYDPLTYLTVTDWDVVYQVHRHPLLAFLVYPLHLLNAALTSLFGVNCVQYVVAVPIVCCSFYSYIFLYRILREVVALPRADAVLLSALAFSFAYLLLSVIVPDHFTVSMFLLLTALYISGVCIGKRREFRWWQSAVLFFITAGVTLSNGIKVFLCGLFVNLRHFFRAKYLLLAVALPAALLWGVATWEYHAFTLPREQARTAEKLRQAALQKEKVARMAPDERRRYERRQARREARLRQQAAKTGRPLENQGFLKWTDVSTSRWQTAYENLFGESIQFHRQHFLEDTLVGRPVFVAYDTPVPYVVEAVVLLLCAAGVWLGRRNRFLWLCLSSMAVDWFIHLVLGFGINEVFIMAPHWLFVLPVCVGFLLKSVAWRGLRLGILLLAVYLYASNGFLLVRFLLSPIQAVL